MNIDNTASGWHDYLISLADEAGRDALATDPRFALHSILLDLARVAQAYAGRLEIERGKDLSRPTDAADAQLVIEPAVVAATAAKPAAPSEASGRPAETVIPAPPQTAPVATPFELPNWLLDAFADLGRRVDELEARVLQLEQRPRDYVPVTNPYHLDLIDVVDEDRTAWNSVERARAALRGMVMREHRRLSASRQAILSRFSALVNARDDDGLIAAELRQHQDRAQELANIDAIMGVKLDEIAANDDLLSLREYDPLKGWPG